MPSIGSLDVDDIRRLLVHLDVVDDPRALTSAHLLAVGDGVNDVFVVDPPRPGADRFVLKVGTFSHSAHLRGGVAAARVLRAYTSLPVPEILAFDEGSDNRPPAVAMTYLPGSPLAAGFDDVPNLTDPARVSLLGAVIAALDALPRDAATRYGSIQTHDMVDRRPRVTATHDAFDDWVVEYTTKHFESPAPHPALERVAPDALEYFESIEHRLPSNPSPSVVLTDLSPGNLLAPDGEPPASVDGLTGVVDLERAKVGPVAFTAANVEYLLTSEVDDPEPVQRALYDHLPFGLDHPLRDCYRLVAVSRAVSGLDTWEAPESEAFDQRARAVARELESILD